MKQSLLLLALALLLVSAASWAGSQAVYVKTVPGDLDTVYGAVYSALEEERFWVVFEVDMGSRMSGIAERWGEDYNRSGLSGVKSMVFCNLDWTNRLANTDPDMLALCPLHLSLYQKEGNTSVVLLRPSVIAADSPAREVAAELETQLIGIVDAALAPE